MTESVAEPITYSSAAVVTADGTIVRTLLVSPTGREGDADACIILIHGGPHSVIIDGFYSAVVMFAKLGFKSLIVNYRGSSGFDEDFLNALPGKVGDADVKDCIAAVDHHVAAGSMDKTRLVLYGGSHGGFLVTHLSAQYADHNWLAVITRNPVIDISTLIEISDIPDWAAVESIGPDHVYDESHVVDAGLMLSKSPYDVIDKVKAPTLVTLGSADKRVPMPQGLKWYRGLKARGVETKCLVYPDKHDLQKVDVHSDEFVNTMIWILSRLNSVKT